MRSPPVFARRGLLRRGGKVGKTPEEKRLEKIEKGQDELHNSMKDLHRMVARLIRASSRVETGIEKLLAQTGQRSKEPVTPLVHGRDDDRPDYLGRAAEAYE